VSLLRCYQHVVLIAERRDVTRAELKTFKTEGDLEQTKRNRMEKLSIGFIGQAWANNYFAALLLPLYPPDKVVNTPYDPGKKGKSRFSHSAIAFVHGGLCPETYEQLLPFPEKINSIAKGLVARLQERLKRGVTRPYGASAGFASSFSYLIASLCRHNEAKPR
jgi:hypothetical protein